MVWLLGYQVGNFPHGGGGGGGGQNFDPFLASCQSYEFSALSPKRP